VLRGVSRQHQILEVGLRLVVQLGQTLRISGKERKVKDER
jgi:hypothetical protein